MRWGRPFALRHGFPIIRAQVEEGSATSGMNGVLSMPNISLGRWSKSAVMTAALSVAGCHQIGDVTVAPFNPRALQQTERVAAENAPLRPIRPLPTTLESPFPDEANPSTKPSVPPATGPAIGTEETVVRMPLHEIIQRSVASNLDI